MCKSHANMGLMLDAVSFLPKSTSALINDYTDAEIADKLQALHDTVTSDSWQKVEKVYAKKVAEKPSDKGKANTKISAKGLGKKDCEGDCVSHKVGHQDPLQGGLCEVAGELPTRLPGALREGEGAT